MNNTNDWTTLHDLGFLYLILAGPTDGDLSDDEWNVIGDKLRDWIEENDPNDWALKKVMDDVVKRYNQPVSVEGNTQFQDSIISIKATLKKEQLNRVIKDFVEISKADGIVHDLEKKFIQMLCGAWETDFGDEIWEHEGSGPARAPYPFIILLREIEFSPRDEGKMLELEGTVIPVFYKVDEHLFAEWIIEKSAIESDKFYEIDISEIYDNYTLNYPEEFIRLMTEDAFWIKPELLEKLIESILILLS